MCVFSSTVLRGKRKKQPHGFQSLEFESVEEFHECENDARNAKTEQTELCAHDILWLLHFEPTLNVKTWKVFTKNGLCMFCV